jgi:hypothetical protein
MENSCKLRRYRKRMPIQGQYLSQSLSRMSIVNSSMPQNGNGPFTQVMRLSAEAQKRAEAIAEGEVPFERLFMANQARPCASSFEHLYQMRCFEVVVEPLLLKTSPEYQSMH